MCRAGRLWPFRNLVGDPSASLSDGTRPGVPRMVEGRRMTPERGGSSASSVSIRRVSWAAGADARSAKLSTSEDVETFSDSDRWPASERWVVGLRASPVPERTQTARYHGRLTGANLNHR